MVTKRKREEEEEDMNNFSDSCSVVRSSRYEKPVHYTLQIQSFSSLMDSLADSNKDRYESRCFNACGYKWKLALYPDGDVKRKGFDHISLYLVSVEDKVLSSNLEINVVFTFLVYDSLKDNYLTIQDGKIRRFHAIKTEWGFKKLISLESFNDASNGFLVNDHCAFGVDIFVKKGDEWKGEALSFVKQPTNYKYTWKINNFSLLPQNTQTFSDPFTVESYNWKLRLEYFKPMCDFLSLHLMFDGLTEQPQTCTEVYAEFEFCALSQLDEVEPFTMSSNRWFDLICGEICGWGSEEFMPLSDLEDPTKGFILNDTLIIEVKINVLSTLKEFL